MLVLIVGRVEGEEARKGGWRRGGGAGPVNDGDGDAESGDAAARLDLEQAGRFLGHLATFQ